MNRPNTDGREIAVYILDTLIFMIAVAFTIFVFLVLYAGINIYKAYCAVEKCLAINSRKERKRGEIK